MRSRGACGLNGNTGILNVEDGLYEQCIDTTVGQRLNLFRIRLSERILQGGVAEERTAGGANAAGHVAGMVGRAEGIGALAGQPCCRQVAPTTALAEKEAVYKAFERALIKAYKFSQDNHAKTVQDVKKYIDIDENYIQTEVYGGYSSSSPDPDKQGTESLKNTLVDLGYTGEYDINKLYNTKIYEAALQSLIQENPSDKIYNELNQHFAQYE